MVRHQPSPASAKSQYANEEIRLFKSRHPERPMIPLIVGGKPGDPELECFPPAMKFKLDANGQITNQPVEVLAARRPRGGRWKISRACHGGGPARRLLRRCVA